MDAWIVVGIAALFVGAIIWGCYALWRNDQKVAAEPPPLLSAGYPPAEAVRLRCAAPVAPPKPARSYSC